MFLYFFEYLPRKHLLEHVNKTTSLATQNLHVYIFSVDQPRGLVVKVYDY